MQFVTFPAKNRRKIYSFIDCSCITILLAKRRVHGYFRLMGDGDGTVTVESAAFCKNFRYSKLVIT